MMGKAAADKALAKKAAQYVFIADDLYKRGFTTPLLKYLGKEQSKYVMNELHNCVCGMHSGHRTSAARVIRAGYYWPTVRQDCVKYVKKCKSFQENGLLIHQPPTNLQTIRLPGLLPNGDRISQGLFRQQPGSTILNCSRKLLYKVDKSRTPCKNHGRQCSKLHMENNL